MIKKFLKLTLLLFCSLSPLLEEEAEPMNKRGEEIA
jgi:hypothetical protein